MQAVQILADNWRVEECQSVVQDKRWDTTERVVRPKKFIRMWICRQALYSRDKVNFIGDNPDFPRVRRCYRRVQPHRPSSPIRPVCTWTTRRNNNTSDHDWLGIPQLLDSDFCLL